MEQLRYIQAGSTGLTEVILIILVVVLLYNGFLRSKIMRDKQNASPEPTPKNQQKVINKKPEEGEYIDYEIVE